MPALRGEGGVAKDAAKPPLYARIDLIRDAHDNFLLMEAELIEPGLYLRMEEGIPERFAQAIDDWFAGD